MPTRPTRALAIHVCADIASRGGGRWPRAAAARDTVRRTARICRQIGVVEQRILAGEGATRAALRGALVQASTTLAGDGLLVLAFSGHTERGEGPIGTARWCLFDGGVELSQVACHLALLPGGARLVIVSDTCYAAAISSALVGAQPTLVVAGCSDEQTMVGRSKSEFVVRLEKFVCSGRNRGSLADLRAALEADTPDCERPSIWTNTEQWWSARALASQFIRTHERLEDSNDENGEDRAPCASRALEVDPVSPRRSGDAAEPVAAGLHR